MPPSDLPPVGTPTDELDRIPWLPFTAADAPRLAAEAGEVLAQLPWVKAAWLHGSLVRAEWPARDLDFAVLTDRAPRSLYDWANARDLVAERLGVAPEVVDLRPCDEGTPRFFYNMLRYGILCCEPDPQARIAFEVRANSLWCEWRPIWERSRAEALARWAGASETSSP